MSKKNIFLATIVLAVTNIIVVNSSEKTNEDDQELHKLEESYMALFEKKTHLKAIPFLARFVKDKQLKQISQDSKIK